jgi:hypothetical protein
VARLEKLEATAPAGYWCGIAPGAEQSSGQRPATRKPRRFEKCWVLFCNSFRNSFPQPFKELKQYAAVSSSRDSAVKSGAVKCC